MEKRAGYSPPAVFRAVGDSTRRAILDRLAAGPCNAGTLAKHFPVSRPAVSRHLRVLRRARLVAEEKQGRERVYRLTPAPLQALDTWLTRYRVHWAAQLVALKSFVEGQGGASERPAPDGDPQ